MHLMSLALCLALVFPTSGWAQKDQITVVITGVVFQEAPPGRDKKLAPFGASSSLEKVEVHAVATLPNRLVVDIPFMGKSQSVRATALLADKSTADLGSADVRSFVNISEDKHKALLTFGVSRLPDKPVLGMTFNGAIPLRVARSHALKTATFDGKPGSKLDFGIGSLSIVSIEGSKIVLKGSDSLLMLSKLTLIAADGRTVISERSGYSLMNNEMESTWDFKGGLIPGRFQAAVFEGVETIDVPIKVTVGRPW